MTRNDRKYPRFLRKLLLETLESRQLMAGDLAHNFLLPHDVNGDHHVTPSDALLVINKLNQRGLDDKPQTQVEFEDVNDDSHLTPSDALAVINRLNSQHAANAPSSLDSWLISATGTASARVELDTEGSSIELQIKVVGAAASTAYSVSINDIALGQLMTDARGRGSLTLGQGDDGHTNSPLPPDLLPLPANAELIIGDIIRGPVASLADDNGADNPTDDHGGKDGGGNVSDKQGGGTTSSTSNQSESEWKATFARVGKLQREAEFETETEHGLTKSKFKAQVEGGTPNTTYDVTVAGVSVGQITTNTKGKGRLTLSSSPKQGELPLPADFPTVDATTVVKIGDASATFVRIR